MLDPFPAPYTFTKEALLAAQKQALIIGKRGSAGIGYPKVWLKDHKPTPYMAFPLLTSGDLWNKGDPGPFRIIYVASDNKFHAVVMHEHSKEPPKVNGIQLTPDWRSKMFYYRGDKGVKVNKRVTRGDKY